MASLKRKYDGESGQVYEETTVPAAPDLSWMRGPKNPLQIRVSRQATPTLLEYATWTLLNNLHRLSVESLQSVPWRLVSDVWKRAQEK
jgi:hypothetical protein